MNDRNVSTSPPVRQQFLDALRGMAILGVMAYHCAAHTQDTFRSSFPGMKYWLAGGFGVQLFFMISAFTIFMTLVRAVTREGHTFTNFYIRRFFRILPMFWVGMLLYSFAPGREQYPQPNRLTSTDYFLTAFVQHGWRASAMGSIVPGGWSIAVEATFYLIAPVLFVFVTNRRRAAALLLASVLFSSLSARGLLYAQNHKILFQNIQPALFNLFYFRWFPAQLPVFACGILVFQIWRKLPPRLYSKAWGCLFLALAVAYLFMMFSAPLWSWRPLISRHVCVSFGFAPLFLALALYHFPPFVNAATVFIGRISYSFYLLHFAMLEVAVNIVRHMPGFHHGAAIFLLLSVITFVLTAPLSYVTFRFIEQAFIRAGSKLIKRIEGRSDVPLVPPAQGIEGIAVVEQP